MDKIVPFLKERLAEKSTKVVIGALLTAALGANVSPENIELISYALIAVLTAIAGFWGVDKKPE